MKNAVFSLCLLVCTTLGCDSNPSGTSGTKAVDQPVKKTTPAAAEGKEENHTKDDDKGHGHGHNHDDD